VDADATVKGKIRTDRRRLPIEHTRKPAEEVDLRSTARNALLLSLSLLAWIGEGYLLFNLWSGGHAASGVSASKYFGAFAHLLPWCVGMKWWRNIRRSVRNSALDAAGAERCYGMITDFLITTYVALSLIEVSWLTWSL
jgi:hypothetical protein